MKQRQTIVRLLCLVLAVFMMASLVLPLILQASAETITEKRARLKAELETINKSIKTNQNNIASQKALKSDYERQKANLEEQVAALQEDINETEQRRVDKEAEIEAKQQQLNETEQMFKDRMVAIYTTRNTSKVGIVLGAESFAEALRYATNLNAIAQHDVDLIAKYEREKAELDAQRVELEGILTELAAQKAELDELVAQLASSIQKVNNTISAENALLQANESLKGEAQAKYEEADKEWRAFVYDTSGRTVLVDEGDMAWPIPGYYRISSDYGVTRTINRVTDVHRGLDVPAPAGTPVYAAWSGTVTTLGMHWTYGTCVKISHGGGYATVYGHLSARYVSDGEEVTKGAKIGAVGSTGNSTGNHLHFELNINGSPTSARPYLDPNIVASLIKGY